MLRTVVWIFVGLVTAIAITAIVGWLLPVGHVAARSASFSVSPETLFGVISNVEGFPAWWKDVSRVEMLTAENGRTRFRQHTNNGPIVMQVLEQTPPARFVTQIADPDQPFGGTWTWEIEPEGSGSRVTITERGEIYNPIFRFMARFVFGYTATMESHLAALETKMSA